MNCPHRAAALRIFVQSVTQVRLPATGAVQHLRQCHAVASPLGELRSLQRGASLSASASRLLHTTVVRRSATEPEANSEPDGAPRTTDGGDQQVSTRPESTGEAQVGDAGSGVQDEVQPRKKKARWSEERKQAAKAAREAKAKEGGGRKQSKPEATEAGEVEGEPSANPTKPLSLQEKAMAAKELTRRTDWKTQKAALKEKFPEGWKPKKKLSPDAITGIKALHAQFPETYTTEVLANKFEVSPEAIRRILKSKWTPSPDEEIRRQERWHNRGKSVWTRWAEMGKKPPRKWRAEGVVRDPKWNEKRQVANDPDAIANAKLSQSLM